MNNSKVNNKFVIALLLISALVLGFFIFNSSFTQSEKSLYSENTISKKNASQSNPSEVTLSNVENCKNAKLKFNEKLYQPMLNYRNTGIKAETRILESVTFKPILQNQSETFAIYCMKYPDLDKTIVQDLNSFKAQQPKLGSKILTDQKFDFVVSKDSIKNQISYPAGEYIKEVGELSVVDFSSDSKGNILRSDKIYEIINNDGTAYIIGVEANNLAPELKLDKTILELEIE